MSKIEERCLSVFSLFLTRAGVYVGVRVCIRTHAHALHVGYSDVSPGVWNRHLGEPEECRFTKFQDTYVCICVRNTHVYIYAGRRDEILD